MAEKSYSAESLQVLSGLEPVRRRPGMYTDTTRPNHLVQEVVDNSVDEAIAGHAGGCINADGSIEVIDDGRGMPVDIHGTPGVWVGSSLPVCTPAVNSITRTITFPAACTVLRYPW